ncbi:MAG TPA: trehalose-phosphatase [Candidatus Methylomirabilis sp.]|nr:trehalose-phosphatase [Candidatus Methylomirabilis sp.]
MSDATRIADWVADWIADGGSLLLLTDYDGTLTPVVGNPADATLSESVRDRLRALARSPKVRLGVVSGRDLDDLRVHVGLAEAIYGGCHGLEVEGPGLHFRHPEAEAQKDILRDITRQLSDRAVAVPGMHVEAKRFGVAVHYRHVASDDVRRVEMEVARAIRRDGGRLKIFHGVKVIEIQPQVGWTKGDCVGWIRDAVRRDAGGQWMLLYMGDDWTDEHVFESFVGQGITIRVGDGAPASRAVYRLADVAGVHGLLDTLAIRLTDGAGG